MIIRAIYFLRASSLKTHCGSNGCMKFSSVTCHWLAPTIEKTMEVTMKLVCWVCFEGHASWPFRLWLPCKPVPCNVPSDAVLRTMNTLKNKLKKKK